jgi:hypothetical protein
MMVQQVQLQMEKVAVEAVLAVLEVEQMEEVELLTQ